MRGEELAGALRGVVGARRIDGLRRLSGGASRETWSFDAVDDDGRVRPLILRRDPPGAPKHGMALEARLFAASATAGIPVPAVVAHSDDPAVVGSGFLVMERLEGETIPRKILRDDAHAGVRPTLARQCGEILARLHAIDPATVPGLEEADQVAQFRAMYDSLDQPHPAFELAFAWLEANRPDPGPLAVIHGDFRNGNFIVGPDGIHAVLDWELAHAGDPMEDLGWLCVKSWRFGAALPVGGFGTYDDLIDAYTGAGGRPVDRQALRWWEVLGTLKWAVMCIIQAVTHTSGAVRSVELAAIGRRVCEVEWDLLRLLPGFATGAPPGPITAAVVTGGPVPSISDIPTIAGLVEAVREYLERDVMGGTEGRLAFHGRVAANVLRTVERELAAGPAPAEAAAASLHALGYESEAALAAAIRSGVAAQLDAVRTYVRDSVEAKLRLANPAYIDQP